MSEMIDMKKVSEPEYPNSLGFTIDRDELDKLGISGFPNVGDEYHMVAAVKVTCVSQRTHEGEDESCVSFQICMMAMDKEKPHEGEGSETPEDEAKEISKSFGTKSSIMSNSYRGA